MTQRFRVTSNGGIRVTGSTNIENAALAITQQPDGVRYVRMTDSPHIVVSVDPHRGTLITTEHGVVTGTDPDWLPTLRRLLSISLPIFKEHTNT